MEKLKKLFQTTGTKNGTYSVGVTVLVLAIVVVANLVLGQIPEKYKNIDVSSTKIYEITDTSKKLLEELDTEVTFTVLAEKESTDERIKTFLSKYAAESKKISVQWIDPVLHPSALAEYEAEVDTIIVACDTTGKQTQVTFGDIIVMDTSSYYYTGSVSESSFDGEGQFTSAVNYVTTEESKKIYRTAGHGENTLSSSITELMNKNNYTIAELNLVMEMAVPKDCELLLMYAPVKDLTEEEKEAVSKYLQTGGKVMILLAENGTTDLPVIASLMKEYGMESVDGYIADPDRCYQGNYYYIFPQLSVYGEMAKGITSEMVLVVNTAGMNVVDPERESIITDSFLTTSQNAAAVTEDEQTEGMFTLGAVATETTTMEDGETTVEGRFTVISAGSLIDSQITDTFTQLENTTVFMNAVSSNFDGVENISIEAKSLATEYNTMQHVGLLGFMAIFGLSIFILVVGLILWFKRRKA